MHELLVAASAANPVPGNAHGSYITMRSKNGLIFGVINIIGNFATVFQDQAYWVRAHSIPPVDDIHIAIQFCSNVPLLASLHLL